MSKPDTGKGEKATEVERLLSTSLVPVDRLFTGGGGNTNNGLQQPE